MIKGKYSIRDSCRLCNSKKIVKFLDMGYLPLAGDFLKKQDLGKEEFFPLRLFFCRSCYLVQLLEVISPKQIFNNYRYLSSVSLSKHFAKYAKEMERYLKPGSFIVEIGSNDGVLLTNFNSQKYKILGVDPAKNIAKLARNKGIDTLNDFFNLAVANEIKNSYGKADAIFANNVLAHIDDMQTVAEGVNLLLKDEGIFVFEVHYLKSLIENGQYDFLYPGEHLSYYSLNPIIKFWSKYNFHVENVKMTSIHGGSIRVYLKKTKPNSRLIEKFINSEKKSGLYSIKTFNKFSENVYLHRAKFREIMFNLAKDGKIIVGYGAPGRANTLLNFAQVGSKQLKFIVDDSPEKIGRYTPGNHIPILNPGHLKNYRIDYLLLLAWTYEKEIVKKKSRLFEKAKIITPFPKVNVK